MPELPEVETICRSLQPLVGRTITRIDVRQPKFRWPISDDLPGRCAGQPIVGLTRRGKYLLMGLPDYTLLWHFGMSGSLNLVDPGLPPQKHDHVDLHFTPAAMVRLTDPRRFGALLLVADPVESHPLLSRLGPEPLSQANLGDHLYRSSRRRRVAVKNFLMDNTVVVGVGNIYANEALFEAGIDPNRRAGRISLDRYRRLALAVSRVLLAAIAARGTTLRDHRDGDGQPGKYAIALQVYSRGGQPCPRCGGLLTAARVGQRGTVWCPRCQR